ncbi:uncharacterized protein LOC115621445 [Scaptodrosophila lebanonensis]|uniref:Uncharacterized protein LOC115621445 n=1 Tax=Drosophila lebanonensis TaxID=7225 RepID=A0A6J2T4L8_DROLE|nr:uncharacterized protein LOC115621445 [Scaptodrosophila lebanonensis]
MTVAEWQKKRFLRPGLVFILIFFFVFYTWESGTSLINKKEDLYIETDKLKGFTDVIPVQYTFQELEEFISNDTQVDELSSKAPTLPINTELVTWIPDPLNTTCSYFVHTPQCKIPAIDPFAPEVMRIFKKETYKKCDESEDFITVSFDRQKNRYKLHLNVENTSCCYWPIIRHGRGRNADEDYYLLPCSHFSQDFVVPKHINGIITKCRHVNGSTILQKDAFAFAQPPRKSSRQKAKKPSVLLWGIDSMSRMNFERVMPLTYQYFQKKAWFELQGYNKIGDNTYPNLMALLTGFRVAGAPDPCNSEMVGGLDACPFLWKYYKMHGYLTAYAEDWTKYSTFNFLKNGFENQPTDYYLRPFILAIEKELKKYTKPKASICMGRRHYAEYVYDYAVDFTNVLKMRHSFGLFWTNSFSHNSFSKSSSMDNKTLQYMRTLEKNGIMENSIIIFLSDHGMRFGNLRQLEHGFLEECLPVLYIWVPDWFRRQYASFSRALEINRNRLTSPYDIYATLQHILHLNNSKADLLRPDGCPDCQSVFFDVPETRGCEDAGIPEHWCTCVMYKDISTHSEDVLDMTLQLIETMNAYLDYKKHSWTCRKLKLFQIISAKEKINSIGNLHIYRVQYSTRPRRALFEATVQWNNLTKLIGINITDITRLNSYHIDSECLKDKSAKKFCICI